MPKLPVVSDLDRSRVREALKNYKRAHGNIGDPELHQRMMFVLELRDEELPRSTLQRFLRGKHRTEDRMVRKYDAFLMRARRWEGLESMGNAVLSFFAPQGASEKATKKAPVPKRKVAPDIANRYRVYVQGPQEVQHAEPFGIPFSTLEFRAIPDAPLLSVVERVFNQLRIAPLTWIDALVRQPQELLEGVAARGPQEGTSIIVLRSLKDFEVPRPRFYLLESTDPTDPSNAILLGSCLAVKMEEPEASPFDSFPVKLVPFSDESAA